MKRRRVISLCVVVALAFCCTAAVAQYSQMSTITFTGVNSDRGLAVNKNPGSAHYGYLYACDSASTPRVVRILRPDPASDGTNAASYVDTGVVLQYASPPASFLFMNVFVGSDDRVWVADYSAKQIASGPAEGGELTPEFTTTSRARGIWVTGAYGQPGTRVYVAETDAGTTPRTWKCEVFEYNGSSWNLVKDLGDLGLMNPYTVTVDSAGNSYWLACNPGASINLAKVKPDLTKDTSFAITTPAFLASSYLPTGLAYVKDAPTATHPEYIYIAGASPAMCVRFDMSGNYIDSFGSLYGVPSGTPDPPAGTYTPIDLVNPGGNNNMWLAADDKHNTYIQTQQYDSVKQVYYPAVVKVHLPLAPDPPSGLTSGNDVYGQVKLSWTAPVPPTQYDKVGTYRIYRSTTADKPASPYSEVMDAWPKWKDAAQGTTAGSFYYWVSSKNNGGESAAIGPVGPIGPSASTAPAPRSKNLTVSYSELTRTDTVEVANFDELWPQVPAFLDRRNVDYTVVWDADSAHPNIENDDIAGHVLLIMPLNRVTSSYTAQCIRDYMKYSNGQLYTGYWNSEAGPDLAGQSDYQLADIYRCHRTGWNGDWGNWEQLKFRLLKPDSAVSENAILFKDIPGGAIQPGSGTISMISQAFTDGTAKVAATWSTQDGTTSPYPSGDPNNAGLIIGYINGQPRCIYTHLLWWYRMSECAWHGTFSATKLNENILTFFGVPFTPVPPKGDVLGEALLDIGDGNQVAFTNAVVTEVLDDTFFQTKNVYLESLDRAAGVKMIIPSLFTGMAFNPGDTLNVSGLIDSEYETNQDNSTTYGDRILKPLEINPTGSTQALLPLYVRNTSVVGPWVGHQNGVFTGPGTNNLGLFARVSGKVTVAPVNKQGFPYYFYIDDGSGVLDGSSHDGPTGFPVANTGLRILVPYWDFNMPPVLEVGKYVTVTGCTAIDLVGLGGDNGVPAIRTASWDQIQVLN